MKISEIMEATPGNGPASASQTKPPPAARPATTAPKPGVDFTPSDVQGGRGSITSKSTSDAGVKTASSQVTGQTRTSDATGTTTTNRSNQTIQKQTPRFAGVQQTTNIDPATGKETTSTNYRGNVGGAKVNVTAPGTMDQFDLKKATKTQVGSGGFTATTNKGGPTTAKFQMGPNSVKMSSANPNQATVTRKVPGQTPQQATVPTSQLWAVRSQPGKPR
jgi:hypothetical protein